MMCARQQKHHHPHALLRKVIGMSGEGEQAGGEEAAADVSVGVRGALLSGQRVLERLELVVLLVGHGLHVPQQVERHRQPSQSGSDCDEMKGHDLKGALAYIWS